MPPPDTVAYIVSYGYATVVLAVHACWNVIDPGDIYAYHTSTWPDANTGNTATVMHCKDSWSAMLNW